MGAEPGRALLLLQPQRVTDVRRPIKSCICMLCTLPLEPSFPDHNSVQLLPHTRYGGWKHLQGFYKSACEVLDSYLLSLMPAYKTECTDYISCPLIKRCHLIHVKVIQSNGRICRFVSQITALLHCALQGKIESSCQLIHFKWSKHTMQMLGLESFYPLKPVFIRFELQGCIFCFRHRMCGHLWLSDGWQVNQYFVTLPEPLTVACFPR